jgi:UDP-N-acetyl-2-amino-2-deoxyglucuronate dehydrogenase
MDKIRFGLVGAGAIAASHITGIGQTEGAELSAICEKNPERLKQLKEKYEIPCFSDVKDMLSSGLVDAVDITTPSGLHFEPALAAISAGMHVLVEKPMEITPERIDQMTEAAGQKGVKLACVFQSRFRPLSRKIKELIDGGILGEIYSASAYCKLYRTQEYYDSGGWRGTWEIDGGGALMNQGIHTIDFLLWNAGDVEELMAAADSRGRKNVEVETLAVALLKFKSGAKGVIESTTLAYPGLPNYIEIFGSKGTITFSSSEVTRFELINPTEEDEKSRQEVINWNKETDLHDVKVKSKKDIGTVVTSEDQGHGPIIEDFVRAVKSGEEPYVPGSEARRSVKLITSIYESAKNDSRPVKVS